jgi:hypothetical protein
MSASVTPAYKGTTSLKTGESDQEKLRRVAQNPESELIDFLFQNNINFGAGRMMRLKMHSIFIRVFPSGLLQGQQVAFRGRLDSAAADAVLVLNIIPSRASQPYDLSTEGVSAPCS